MQARIAARAGWLAAATLVPLSHAAGAQYDFSARVGAMYSDNANRTSANTISSTAAVAGLTLLAKRPVGRWRYDASGDLSYYQYSDSAVSGQLYGGLQVKTSYDIIPESFLWDAAGSLTQIRQDLLRPAAPGNLENVISLSTGPTLKARFGNALEATLDGRVSTTKYSRRNFDSDSVGAKLMVAKRLSARNLLGVGVSADRTNYNSQLGLGSSHFNRRELFVNYNVATMRSSVDLQAGYSKYSGGSVHDSNPVVRLHATRRVTPFISAYADYSQEYPTSDEDVYSAPVTNGIGNTVDNSVLTAGPRTLKNAGAGLILRWPRTTGDVGYSRRAERGFAAGSGQRTYDEVHVKVTRLLTPRSHASIYATYSQEKATLLTLDVKGSGVGGEFGFNFGTAFGLDVRLQRDERRSVSALGRYSELSAGVFLRYGLATQPVVR